MADKETTDDMKALGEEIDAGVEAAMKPAETEEDDGGSDDDANRGEADGSASDDGGSGGEEAPVTDEGGSEEGAGGDDAVTDEHLERAVQAGLTMAEARQFTSAAHLEAMVSKLAGKKDDGEGANEDGEGDGEGEDPLAAIPDLDPEEYDEKIVSGFKALKDLARRQQETIKDLRKDQTATSPDWFKSQVAGLDKPVSQAVASDPTKLEAIRDKFTVLEAGYKAAKKDVSREAIFQEAVRITMGDAITQAAVDTKARQLAQRGKQHIHRPAGHRATPTGDPLSEVAAEVDQKFFGKV